MNKKIYLIEVGYSCEGGDFYSPVFVTGDPSIVDDLNAMGGQYNMMWEAMQDEIQEFLKEQSYEELQRSLKDSMFGGYSDSIKHFEGYYTFVCNEIPFK